MTPDQIIEAANRAWQAGQMDQWKTCMWLLRTLGHLTPEAQRRCNADVQFDYEREAEAQGVSLNELMR